MAVSITIYGSLISLFNWFLYLSQEWPYLHNFGVLKNSGSFVRWFAKFISTPKKRFRKWARVHWVQKMKRIIQLPMAEMHKKLNLSWIIQLQIIDYLVDWIFLASRCDITSSFNNVTLYLQPFSTFNVVAMYEHWQHFLGKISYGMNSEHCFVLSTDSGLWNGKK